MKLLVDTDAFCKLGAAGLLNEGVALLGAEVSECGGLPALPHMLRRGRLHRLLGADVCDMLLPVADAIGVVTTQDGDWLDRLAVVEAIDPGEAQLLAAAAQQGLVLISGDKRALRAIKYVQGLAAALDGRVVVLEALLIALCDNLGVEAVRERVQVIARLDQAIKVCFASPAQDPRDGLRSYFKSLSDEVAPLALWECPSKSGL